MQLVWNVMKSLSININEVRITVMSNHFEQIYKLFKSYLKFFVATLKSACDTSKNNLLVDKICVVDDNIYFLKAAKNIIAKYNEKEALEIVGQKKEIAPHRYEIIKASDGVEALALFQLDYCYKKSIKFIISDQNMNMMNGDKLLSLVSQYDKEKNTRLYISSADNESQGLNNGNEKFDVLNKPIALSELRKILNKK